MATRVGSWARGCDARAAGGRPGGLSAPPPRHALRADAQVGEWEGDQRTVSFTTPVDAPGGLPGAAAACCQPSAAPSQRCPACHLEPAHARALPTARHTRPMTAAIIKRMVGTEVMRVQEAQARAALPGGAIQLTSLPVPEMPGGAKFQTRAVFTFRNAAAGCKVRRGVAAVQQACVGLRASEASHAVRLAWPAAGCALTPLANPAACAFRHAVPATAAGALRGDVQRGRAVRAGGHNRILHGGQRAQEPAGAC